MGVLLWMAWITPLKTPPEIHLRLETLSPLQVTLVLRNESLPDRVDTLVVALSKDTTVVLRPPSVPGENRVTLRVHADGVWLRRTYTWTYVPPPRISSDRHALAFTLLWPGIYRLRLYDIAGRRVVYREFRVSKENPTFRVKGIPPGVYIYELVRERWGWSGKVVVF